MRPLARFLRTCVRFLKEKGLRHLDAEGVIGLSSPYKGTAERSSATKKPHKNEEIRRIFLDGFQHFYQIATKLNEIWVV